MTPLGGDLDWIDSLSERDALVLSRLWRNVGLEKLAVADMLLERALTTTGVTPV